MHKAELLSDASSALWSGSGSALLRRRPLRTVRAPHNAYGSSLSKAFSNTQLHNFFSSGVNKPYGN